MKFNAKPMINRLPGGLLDNSTEFFTTVVDSKQRAKVSHRGQVFNFNDAPKCRIEILNNRYNDLSEKQQIAYEVLSVTNKCTALEQMTICLFGAINSEPDINTKGSLSEPEYVPCIHRSKCKFEGIGCNNIMVSEGVFLSKSETEVFKLVALPDKEIADRLFISILTVQKHFKNIRDKTGFASKIEMAIWATQKGII